MPFTQTLPRFHYFIVLATIAPLVLTPLGLMVGAGDIAGDLNPSVVSIVLGNGHVAATMFFFIDRESRGILAENRTRLIYLPLALAVIFTLYLVAAGKDGLRYLVFINIIYLFYHYQRQNFGLASLANRGLPPQARWLVDCALFLPMAAGCLIYGVGGFLLGGALDAVLPDRQTLFLVAQILYAGGVAALVALFAFYARRLNLVSGALMTAGCLFFLPLLLFPDDPVLAFGSFAAAHGAQYLLIMGYTAAGTRNSTLIMRALITVVVMCTLLQLMSINYLLLGIAAGLTWGHYLIDARIWKLSLPDSRRYILSRIKDYI